MKKQFGILGICLNLLLLFCACNKIKETNNKTVEYLVGWNLEEFDPSTNWDGTSIALCNVFEPLLWYKNLGDFEPALAESWKKSKDGLSWTFNIRKNVLFHNGKPLNASSVKYSIERTKSKKQGAAWIWDAVKEINVLGDYQIELKLIYQAPLDLIASSGYGAWIFSPNEEGNNTWNKFSGTGPYYLKNVIPNQLMELEYFPRYWQGWKDQTPKSAKIRTVNESSTQIQMILSGQSDILRQPPLDLVSYLKQKTNLEIISSPSYENILGLINVQKAPTNDLKVRQALEKSIDYDGIIKNILYGYGSYTTGPIVESLWGPYKELIKDDIIKPTFSLEKAKELFAESKISKTNSQIVLSYTAGDELLKNVAIALQSNLRKSGVELQVESFPWPTQWARAKELKTSPNILLFYYWPTYPTPYDPLLAMFHTEKEPSYNLSYYSNKAFDELIDGANELMSTNRQEAIKKFAKAQNMLQNDVPALCIADLQRAYVVLNRVKGFSLSINPAYPNAVFFYKLSIDQ